MPGKNSFGQLLTGAALFVLLTGCTAAPQPTPTPVPSGPASTSAAPSVTSTAPSVPASAPPSATASGTISPIPTMRPSGSDRIPEPSVSEPGSGSESPAGPTLTSALTLYYVAVGDRGKSGPEIGCGDSLVAASTPPQIFTDKVRASLDLLLSATSAPVGESGLENALAASNLSFVSSSIQGDTVTVNLRGKISSGGACDDPRIIEQLEHTARTAAGASKARTLVNGIPIARLLEQK